MKVYWGDQLIKSTRGNNKLIFVENLKMFVNNNKGRIKFKQVEAINGNDGNITYCSAIGEDDTEWRQIYGIHSKEELEEWFNNLYENSSKPSYKYFKYNLPRMCWNWATRILTCKVSPTTERSLLTPPYKELCSNDEELYKAFSSSYFNGYFFNNTNPKTTYENVFITDIKSNHSSTMVTEKFPTKFIPTDPKNFKKIFGKKHFYGKFIIEVEKPDPYYYCFGQMYNGLTNTFTGYFNDIDFNFIKELTGIKRVIFCERLWIVETKPLPQELITAIKLLFKWKEEFSKKKLTIKKNMCKNALEKIYGNCCKRRFYPERYVWDIDKQEITKEKVEYNWENIQKGLKNHWDYSIGVWTCSYVRLKLLRLKNKMGKDCLYGDIDSIMFKNKDNLKYVKEFNQDKELLGKLELKNICSKFRVLDKKWYCFIDEMGKVNVKCSGANPKIVKKYLEGIENPVENFSKDFPLGINPYKRIRQNSKGELEYYWCGGSIQDYTLSNDKRVIISCAGSGKTTTLIEEVKNKFNTTNDKITVIAFTNKNVDELREKLGINNERLEIRTLDSLAASLLENSISGDLFEVKLERATELLREDPSLMLPSHLFIDEFQDLDLLKFNFINSIPAISRFYIGDPNQSIYGYSGAQNLFNRLNNFKTEYRSINYRCPQNINDYAEGFLDEDKRPQAISNLKGNGEINFINEIPNDDSIILCRTNKEVNTIKELYPMREVLTIHKAKGLTFAATTVVGIQRNKNTQEEQNIAYVACSRATQKLNIVLKEVC